jgi:hypothetical protein
MGAFIDQLGKKTAAGQWLWFVTLTFRTPYFPWARGFPIEQPAPAPDFVHNFFVRMIHWIEGEVHVRVEYFVVDQSGELGGRLHQHCGLSWPGLFEYRWRDLQENCGTKRDSIGSCRGRRMPVSTLDDKSGGTRSGVIGIFELVLIQFACQRLVGVVSSSVPQYRTGKLASFLTSADQSFVGGTGEHNCHHQLCYPARSRTTDRRARRQFGSPKIPERKGFSTR